MSPCCQIRPGKVLDTDGQNLSVQIGEFAVIPLQLPELLNAVGSPESPVEDQYHVLLAAI